VPPSFEKEGKGETGKSVVIARSLRRGNPEKGWIYHSTGLLRAHRNCYFLRYIALAMTTDFSVFRLPSFAKEGVVANKALTL